MNQVLANKRLVVQPGPAKGQVMLENGELRFVPAGWKRVSAGDARIPRLLAAGPSWCVTNTGTRSRFTCAVWVPERRLRSAEENLANSPLLQRIVELLDFAPRHRALAKALARAVAESLGREPLADGGRSLMAKDLEQALVLWLGRHLDSEGMPRRGARGVRERVLERALSTLNEYRLGLPRDPTLCPLACALAAEGS
ncbi:MAG: hypothetical protein ACI8QC_001072 [Planctomycetota bacterium]|jgi:hypothetical protein